MAPKGVIQKFNLMRDEVKASFPERAAVVDGILASALSGQHVLLLGPPGTAKSALVRVVSQAFGGRYFEWLLTKFSTPEELFGPISLKALEQDRFARVVGGKIPEAEFAFLDEVFKANSAILNSLLSLVNERVFHNDGQVIRCPLVSCVGASNELPEGKELEALFDRFLLRFQVDYLKRPSNFRAVVMAPDPGALQNTLSMADLATLQAQAAGVQVSADTLDALQGIRDQLGAEGIVASDRRWKQALKLVKAVAFMDGGTSTCPEDLAVLADCLWREPKDRPVIARIIGKLADPAAARAAEIVDAAREVLAKVRGASSGDRTAYVQQASKALSQFKEQQKGLQKLKDKAGRRAVQAIDDASQEIAAFHSDLAKVVSEALGLAMPT